MDKLTNVPIDPIIAVKEGVGIVPHPFPKVRTNETAFTQGQDVAPRLILVDSGIEFL